MIAISIVKKRIVQWGILLGVTFAIVGGTCLCAFGLDLAMDHADVKLPIIMYHSILKDPSRTGDYVVTPKSLEEDMAYLKSKGYNTVVMQDLINYVYHDQPLQEHSVMLTFDDGFTNNMTYLVPLLEKYDMKAVISPVGIYSENYTTNPDPNPAYAYLTWDDIRTMSASGLIEIQNHSYDMHGQNNRSGAKKKRGETLDAYATAFYEDTMKMQQCLEEKSGVIATTYTYPFGGISDVSLDLVKEMGFLGSLSCRERVNTITKDPDCLYQLGRYNRSGCETTARFMHKLGID